MLTCENLVLRIWRWIRVRGCCRRKWRHVLTYDPHCDPHSAEHLIRSRIYFEQCSVHICSVDHNINASLEFYIRRSLSALAINVGHFGFPNGFTADIFPDLIILFRILSH